MNVFRNTFPHRPPKPPLAVDAPVITDLDAPKILYIRTAAEDESDPDITVKAGDTLTAGAPLTCDGCISPVAGTVAGVSSGADLRGGRQAVYVKLETSGNETNKAYEALDPETSDPQDLAERLRSTGIVSGTPQPVALDAVLRPDSSPLSTVIVLAADQEPGVSSTRALLAERQEHIGAALSLVGRIAEVQRVLLALPDGTAAPAGCNAPILTVPPIYPETLPPLVAERSGETAPIGVITLEAALDALDAVRDGLVPSRRVLTVLGKNNAAPRNLRVAIGTPLRQVLEHCGCEPREKDKVIAGGPMRGFAQYSRDAAIDAGIDALTIIEAGAVIESSPDPCVNCGPCIDACPMNLQIQLIGRYAEFHLFERTVELGIDNCIECGMCASVCTARRPLLQLVRLAKSELKATETTA